MSALDNPLPIASRVTESAFKTLEGVLETILDRIEKSSADSFAKEVLKHGKSGQGLDYQICKDFAAKDFANALREAGVPVVIMEDSKTGLNVVVTRDCDRTKVTDIKMDTLMKQQRSVQQPLDVFQRTNIGKNLEIIKNRTPAEEVLFRAQARELNLHFASSKNKDGTVNLYFAERDRDKAHRAFRLAIANSKGIKGRMAIDKISQGLTEREEIFKNMEMGDKEFYLVSATNTKSYMHLTQSGFERTLDGDLKTDVSRMDDKFLDKARRDFFKIKKPVYLTKEEFDNATRDVTLDEVIKQKLQQQKSQVPNLNEAQQREAELERIGWQLVHYKMSLDNSEQQEISSDFYNKDVSFSEFIEIEKVNDDHEKEEIIQLVNAADNLKEEDKDIIKNYIGDVLNEKAECGHVYIDPEKFEPDVNLEFEELADNGFDTPVQEEELDL